jgi:hypothetical protein
MDRFQEEIAWEGLPEEAPRGSSLGNRACFLRADGEANLDGLWLAANNRWYSGELSLQVMTPTGTLRRVKYAPAYQEAQYESQQRARWSKTLFVEEDHAVVHVRIHGEGFQPLSEITLLGKCRIGAARSEVHRAQPWQDCERQWTLKSKQDRLYITQPLDGGKDRLCLKLSHLPVQESWTEPARLTLLFSFPATKDGVLDICLSMKVQPDPEVEHSWEEGTFDPVLALERTQQRLAEDILLNSDVSTDFPAVHRAVAWGKVGSRRVWHRYGTGDWGFTNDPPGNTIVTRDAAWFVFGADHFAPEWSRQLLETLNLHALYPNGKIAEYVRLAQEEVTRDDYGLNLNDATPLYILAVEHHWNWLQNSATLGSLYPSVRAAANWILEQKGEEGLVWCDGKGTNVHGIGGWRNIIPGYRLSGALTELNALCVAALRGAGRMAQSMRDSTHATLFPKEAEKLSRAMSQLVDPKTGLFALTRESRETDSLNTQLAIDLVLPMLFEAGPKAARIRTAFQIVKGFRCRRGLRILSPFDPAYHPRFGWGLMGGSWPNATAWAAAAIAPYLPDLAWQLAEEIAQSLFPQKGFSTGVSVPGQFPEWFDGDTGESAGMSLSPWMPATYVWLVQERLNGAKPPLPSPISGNGKV